MRIMTNSIVITDRRPCGRRRAGAWRRRPWRAGLHYEPGLPLPNSKLIIWLFLSTEIMFFAALIGMFIVMRFGAPAWPMAHEVFLSEPIGAFNTFVLICSSVTIVLALEAARANKAGLAKVLMAG